MRRNVARPGALRPNQQTLPKIESKRVQNRRCCDKADNRKAARPGRPPVKDERRGALRSRSSHRGEVAAKATDEMPCSKAAFVTATTVSYGVRRSAFIIIERPSRLAASRRGPSCCSVIF